MCYERTTAVGLVVYVIIDLPRAIPRNIGRKLALSLSSSSSELLSSSSSSPTQIITFPTAHSDRIAKETRKVLRLAGWDLRERFRAALEKAGNERREVEGVVERAEAALKFLNEFEERCEREEEVVRAVQV
jgi:mitofusin